ncbi:helix-turn-helix domain-containing protein [Paenibacillus phocaensis]|uniref:helix-turn-helix domain-containing protein n=1 Tax=Paenibacillus phocaensis TaxID=1776378 RepID=UPI000839B284|nr:helix-turn-helix transcriptional regulator [Paenibacillus phocaensis]
MPPILTILEVIDIDTPNFKTWKNLKRELKYKSDLEKEVITELAHLVNEIVRQRKTLGLTQREVAERAGITQAQVARLETGSSIPSMETVIKVGLSLGLTVTFKAHEEQSAAYAHA